MGNSKDTNRIFNFQFSIFKLHEWVFIFAGIITLIAIPFLSQGGFYLWLAVKSIYLIGVIVLFLKIK